MKVWCYRCQRRHVVREIAPPLWGMPMLTAKCPKRQWGMRGGEVLEVIMLHERTRRPLPLGRRAS